MAIDGNTANVSQFRIGDCLYEYRDDVSLSELDQKVDKEQGKGLSEENFSTVLKTKLDGIETGAEVNVAPDETLSSLSNNAVRNSTLYAEFNNVRSYVDQKTAYATDQLPGTIVVGNNLVIDPLTGKLSATSAYELPVASSYDDADPQLGGIKVGATLNIDSYGVVNIDAATTSSLGGVIVGDGLSILNGTLSINAIERKSLGVINIGNASWDTGNKITERKEIASDGNLYDYYFLGFDNDYYTTAPSSEYIVSRHWIEIDSSTNKVYFNFILYNPDGQHPADEYTCYGIFYKKEKSLAP